MLAEGVLEQPPQPVEHLRDVVLGVDAPRRARGQLARVQEDVQDGALLAKSVRAARLIRSKSKRTG